MAIDLKHFRQRLEARRQELRENLEAGEEATRPVELDQASVGRLSRIDAMQVQAMAQASQARRRRELARIEAAFRRIEQAEFGYCLSCGVEIIAARLELDPSVQSCIRCAGQAGA